MTKFLIIGADVPDARRTARDLDIAPRDYVIVTPRSNPSTTGAGRGVTAQALLLTPRMALDSRHAELIASLAPCFYTAARPLT